MKVLLFIATERDGSTEPGDTYVSCFFDIYYIASVCPIVCSNFLGRYLNAYNVMYNHNIIQQSEKALDKYWFNQSCYFIVATIVALIMVITYGNILSCHGIS